MNLAFYIDALYIDILLIFGLRAEVEQRTSPHLCIMPDIIMLEVPVTACTTLSFSESNCFLFVLIAVL